MISIAPHLITVRCNREMALVGDDFGCLRFHEHLKAMHLRQRRLRFVVTAHLFQNIRKHKILARLIGLA
jgi:hypothetical protein